MKVSRFVLGFLVVAAFYAVVLIVLASLTGAASGQVHPTLDPGVPSYTYQEPVSGKLTISGSDTMKPLVQAWLDGLRQRHPNLDMTLSGHGSETGLTALLEHRTELAAMSRRMTASEISEFVKEYGYEPTEVPVAGDALGLFVHKDNPIAGLSLEELDAMFCRERRRGVRYSIDSWGLVGLMDEWFETPIRIYGRNGKSGTSYFFREEVCKGGTFSPQLIDAPGSASVVQEVGMDQHGIGFSSIGYKTSSVKPVPIAQVKGGRYVDPTFESAMDGSYPLRRNLYLYIAKPPKTSPAPATAELVRFALSLQGQRLALDLGYFPLAMPEIERITSKWSTSVNAAQAEMQGRTEPRSGS
jgi:phosphate transport system substrate-binding protein